MIKDSVPNAVNVMSARRESVVVRLSITIQTMLKSATSACCHHPLLDRPCKTFHEEQPLPIDPSILDVDMLIRSLQSSIADNVDRHVSEQG